jgi:hypothetical protein
MRRQSLRLRALLDSSLHCLAQLRDDWVQPIQQLQQILPSPADGANWNDSSCCLSIRRNRLLHRKPSFSATACQLTHDPRTRLHHTVPMPKSLPQITVLQNDVRTVLAPICPDVIVWALAWRGNAAHRQVGSQQAAIPPETLCFDAIIRLSFYKPNPSKDPKPSKTRSLHCPSRRTSH